MSNLSNHVILQFLKDIESNEIYTIKRIFLENISSKVLENYLPEDSEYYNGKIVSDAELNDEINKFKNKQ
jgi:hypothetical protein